MDHTAVLAKIRKLMALAADTRGNPHEVEAAARQAQAMMRKYNIDMAEAIEQGIRKDSSSIESRTHVFNFRPGKVYKETPLWASFLATAVAQAHDCGARLTGVDRVTFYGYSVDCEVAVYIYEVLLKAIYRNSPKGGGVAVANGFRLGAVHEIKIRYHEEAAAAQAEAVKSRALVVVKQQAIEEKFGVFNYEPKKTSQSMAGAVGYASGRIYGKSVDTRQTGIGHNSTPTPRLK